MDLRHTDSNIAYQNKDIVSKLLGQQMKGKRLSLFGLKSNLKIVDARPTNIPIIRARELRMDNLFELEDGSVAILDYESDYKKSNFTKYGRYSKEVLGMTQVGKMLMDEGRQEAAKKTARNMLKRGDSLEEIAEVLEIPVETVKAWEHEAYAMA